MAGRRMAGRRREGRDEAAEDRFDDDRGVDDGSADDEYADEGPEEGDEAFGEDDEYAGEDRRDADGELADDDDYAEEEPADDAEGAYAEADDFAGDGHRGGSGRGRSDGLTAAAAARAGLRQIVELTGKEPEGVTAVEAAEGGWVVGVEVVDSHRVPASADLLALYEADVGPDGGLMGYRRLRRYVRGRAGSDEGP